MLTADHVRARKREGTLELIDLEGKTRERAQLLAETLLQIAARHVGKPRDAFDEACDAIVLSPRERRIGEGMRKLIEDRCDWATEAPAPPDELRREVFSEAGQAWQTLDPEHSFDRTAVLAAVAARKNITAEALERALYADLRGAQVLTAFDPVSAEALTRQYQSAQAQAVLLRAVKVRVDVFCATPGAYRTLFHKLKFLQLLFSIEPHRAGGYRIEIDGPFSLFESVTKYGLKLALALPAIAQCDAWALTAHVRWGKSREALQFHLEGRGVPAREGTLGLPDDVQALLDGLKALGCPFEIAPADEVVTLPGVGLCVPDLAFRHRESGEVIYLEMMGYWSRDAVWRRIELARRGMPERILFAVSERLRVSEAALPANLPGALYVYKRTPSPRAVLDRIEALRRRRNAP